MKRETYEVWEDNFISICEKNIEEEPFYPYEHLWKKGFDVQQAFETYLEENTDLAEKFAELKGETLPVASESERHDFLELARKLEESQILKKQKEIEKKIENTESKYCPECGRTLGSKSLCKCGYRRPGKKKKSSEYEDYNF